MWFHLVVMYRADIRSNNKMSKPTLIHKKGTKVVGLNCNPLQPDLLLSCGNDHFVSSDLSLMSSLIHINSVRARCRKILPFLVYMNQLSGGDLTQVKYFGANRLEYGICASWKLGLLYIILNINVLLVLHIFHH